MQAALASHRVSMETEAFERARAFDTETIIRQNEVIKKSLREIDRLQNKVRYLTNSLDQCEEARRSLSSADPP